MPFRKYSSFHAAFHFSFLENVLLPPSNQYIYISLSTNSHFFPPPATATETTASSRGNTTTAETTPDDQVAADSTPAQLPSVPTTDPADPDHAQKKQKQDPES